MSKEIRSEEPAEYNAVNKLSENDQHILERAKKIIRHQLDSLVINDDQYTSPKMIQDFLVHELALEENEVFCVVWLNNRNKIIAFERMFFGSVDSAHVYPRVVVRRALEVNAANVIIAHNHPSGVMEPSQGDIQITRKLREALQTVDIRLLDHIIVGGTETCSFAERGLV